MRCRWASVGPCMSGIAIGARASTVVASGTATGASVGCRMVCFGGGEIEGLDSDGS